MKTVVTLEVLKQLRPHTIIAAGLVENSKEGIFMTSSNLNRRLLWVAKRGEIHDWAIYCNWEDENEIDDVLQTGHKIGDLRYVEKLVDCDKEALQMYRR